MDMEERLYKLLNDKDFLYSLLPYRRAHYYPINDHNEVSGAGLSYKAKVIGRGKNKIIRVSGGAFNNNGSLKNFDREHRLANMERERLARSLFIDLGLSYEAYDMKFFKVFRDDLINAINNAFPEATKFSRYNEALRPYKDNAITYTDTITQAKNKIKKLKDKEKQIQEAKQTKESESNIQKEAEERVCIKVFHDEIDQFSKRMLEKYKLKSEKHTHYNVKESQLAIYFISIKNLNTAMIEKIIKVIFARERSPPPTNY